jgi:hypothetical protein
MGFQFLRFLLFKYITSGEKAHPHAKDQAAGNTNRPSFGRLKKSIQLLSFNIGYNVLALHNTGLPGVG